MAALVTLAFGPSARAQGAFVVAGPADQEVLLEADQLVYGWEAQTLRLEGHVVARRGDGLLRASKGTLDRAHNILSLEGGVLGVQGKDVFLADSALVDLTARSADLKGAVIYLKERAADPNNPRAGKNSLILHGARVRQLGPGVYSAEDVTLTPCDCVREPDYELLAHSATLDGDRAHLSGARLRMFGATLPLFPLSLPLTQRQSGLLAPEIAFAGPFWFTYAQPVFFTLGRSNDITVTPGWYTGGTVHAQTLYNRSIKGPRLGLEWRYAPAPGTAGGLSLDLYDDLDQSDSKAATEPFAGERGTGEGRGYHGIRGLAHLNHRTESGPFVFAAQGVAATDVMAARDRLPYGLESLQDLLRTDLGAWDVDGPLTVGADATLMQDVRSDNAKLPSGDIAPDRRLFGPEARNTFQRLPGLFAQLAPVPLGPALFTGEASVAQFESFTRVSPEEQRSGFGPTDLGASSALATLGDAARSPALRFDLSPRLLFDGPASLPLDLRAELGGRVDAWVMEGHEDRNRSRAYALAGASVGLPLERRFGDVLHRIEPTVAVRALSRQLESGGPPIGDLTDAGGAKFRSDPEAAQQGLTPAAPVPGVSEGIPGVPAARRAYDEIDFAAPVSGAVETTASLSQSLWRKAGAGAARFVSFNLQQDALLWAHGGDARLGEASADASLYLGPLGVSGGVRYDWRLHDIVALGAYTGVHDARGDEVHGSLGFLRGASSARLRAGIDELFSAARFDQQLVQPGPLSGSAVFGGSTALPRNLRLAYQGIWQLIPGLAATQENFRHSASLTYDTPCHCAAFAMVLTMHFHDAHLLKDMPDFALRIDLKSLGSFGTF